MTHREQEYFDCLDIKQDELDRIMALDQTYWMDNLREAKERLISYKKNLQALLMRQTNEIESLLQIDTSNRKYTLRKLALWGEQVSPEEINFEWPVDQDMIWPTIQLQALEMKSNACVLSSVRCVLSNGISSPVFEREGYVHDEAKTLTFGATDVVRYVQAFDSEGDTISRLHFMDANKQDIASYNPIEMKKKGPVLKLREEESLIGVYGVLGKREGFFTSFGFIVKAWHVDTTPE